MIHSKIDKLKEKLNFLLKEEKYTENSDKSCVKEYAGRIKDIIESQLFQNIVNIYETLHEDIGEKYSQKHSILSFNQTPIQISDNSPLITGDENIEKNSTSTNNECNIETSLSNNPTTTVTPCWVLNSPLSSCDSLESKISISNDKPQTKNNGRFTTGLINFFEEISSKNHSNSGNNTLKEKSIRMVFVEKNNGKALGFNIIGGAGLHTPIYITKILYGTGAYRCKNLKRGDKILEINGVRVLNATHDDIKNLVANCGTLVPLKVQYCIEELESLEKCIVN